MREDRLFARFVEYSFFAVFAALIVSYALDKLFGTSLSPLLVFLLTLIPAIGLILILPFSSRKTAILTVAVLIDMAVALYLAFR